MLSLDWLQEVEINKVTIFSGLLTHWRSSPWLFMSLHQLRDSSERLPPHLVTVHTMASSTQHEPAHSNKQSSQHTTHHFDVCFNSSSLPGQLLCFPVCPTLNTTTTGNGRRVAYASRCCSFSEINSIASSNVNSRWNPSATCQSPQVMPVVRCVWETRPVASTTMREVSGLQDRCSQRARRCGRRCVLTLWLARRCWSQYLPASS